MEYVALDFETTGLDPQWDRVIEVGAVAFTSGEVVDRLEGLADPGRSIPDPVVRLTGIGRQLVAGAPTSAELLQRLSGFVGERQPVAHGARLEIAFMDAAGIWPAGTRMLDTLDLSRVLLPDAPSHSLPQLALHLDLDQPRPHRAPDDADATRQLLLLLRRRAAELPNSLKEKMLALIAPYAWPVAGFLREALSAGATSPVAERSPLTSVAVMAPEDAPRDDLETLRGLLAPDGPLATTFPQYEQREGQLQMLLAVAQIIKRGGRLMVEAGTGTGKSLAYLIPAVARAVRHGERVVIATHTHTLQEQLVGKDIPSLSSWLPWSFRACLLKGRANYLSLRRWHRYLAEPCADEEELCFKLQILVWLETTESGDRSELRLHGREEVYWARIASDPLDCLGIHCTSEDCFVHRAREAAEDADVVVINHALLLADAVAEGGLLPAFDHLIVDEAHHLEDAATQGLRTEVDAAGVLALLGRLSEGEGESEHGLLLDLGRQGRLDRSNEPLEEARQILPRTRALLADLFADSSDWLRAQLTRETERREEGVRLTPRLREQPGWPDLAARAADACTSLAGLETMLRRSINLSQQFVGGEEPDQNLRELEILRGRLAEAEALLREAFAAPEENRVYWFSLFSRTNALILRSAPVEVGGLLHDLVFAPRHSVVLTSASLAVAGSFAFFRDRLGVGGEVETLVVPSSFDYLRQALVCLPIDAPEPRQEEFSPFVASITGEIAATLRGRTMALFTSHQQLREVYEALKQRADLDDVLILGQGIDGPRRQVLKTFQGTPRALLLGTSSFWEGVDLPGDQLSCVIVARLPFPVPSEPIYAARAERVPDAFAQLALPSAALRLKQGFGRLIRRGTDRGAVVILDGRILSKDYGRTFLDALPRASRFIGPSGEMIDRVRQWLPTPD